MSKKTWIIFGAVCVVLLGGLIYLSDSNKLDVSGVDINAIQPATLESGDIADNVFGNAKSKVVMIEYGDFQCPGCASAHPNIKALTEKYKDQMAFVFRNLPLTTIHPNARIAAASAEAAGLQGKYWEMNNTIYEGQSNWNNLPVDKRVDFFVGVARELKLDTDKFRADLESTQVSQKIAFDQALAAKGKITGTPDFSINGKTVDLYVKDGEIVPANTAGASPIWSDMDAFEKHVIIPALKEAGIPLPEAKE